MNVEIDSYCDNETYITPSIPESHTLAAGLLNVRGSRNGYIFATDRFVSFNLNSESTLFSVGFYSCLPVVQVNENLPMVVSFLHMLATSGKVGYESVEEILQGNRAGKKTILFDNPNYCPPHLNVMYKRRCDNIARALGIEKFGTNTKDIKFVSVLKPRNLPIDSGKHSVILNNDGVSFWDGSPQNPFLYCFQHLQMQELFKIALAD